MSLRRVVDIRHDHMAHPYMLFMRVDDVDQRQRRPVVVRR